MEVTHGRADMTVTEQALDGVDIDTGFQQVRRESVAQGMNATAVINAGGTASSMIDALGRLIVKWAVASAIGKQPVFGAINSPVQTQGFEQAG